MESWEVHGIIRQLPKTLQVDSKNFEVIGVEDIPEKLLKILHTYDERSVYVCKSGQGDSHLLERYGAKFWICWPLKDFHDEDLLQEQPERQEIQQNQEKSQDWSHLQLKELLYTWKEPDCKVNTEGFIGLDMTVPNGTHSLRTDIVCADPHRYLEVTYYESLFLIHMPLAYFVKSNLSRCKNICKSVTATDTNVMYQGVLQHYLFTINEFDGRHGGAKILEHNINNQVFREKQDALLNKYRASDKKRLQNDLCTILKIREIKLQIVILLESIYINNLDCNFVDYENKYCQKLKKRSLTVAKNVYQSKKSALQSTQKKTELTLDFCERLDLYLDKLCIQDILLASEPVKPHADKDVIEEFKKNILNKNKESSSVGFANFVLIPYYNKRAPNAIRFIINKLKGPKLRSKKLRENKPSPKGSLYSPAEQLAGTSRSRASSIMSFTSSSPQLEGSAFAKRPSIGDQTRELITSRSNSNLNSFIESENNASRKPSFISRTASDLTMNHLQKRQLPVTDFSLQTLITKSNISELNSNRELVSSSNKVSMAPNSFRRVGKRKDGASNSTGGIKPGNSTSRNIVQVESTPFIKAKSSPKKGAKLLNIVESPINTIDSCSNLEFDKSHATETGGKQPHKKNIRRRLFAP